MGQIAQRTTQRSQQQRGEKLRQVHSGGEQGHDRRSGGLACLHRRLGDEEGDAHAVGKTDAGRTQQGPRPAADQSQEQKSKQEENGSQQLTPAPQCPPEMDEEQTAEKRHQVCPGHDDGDEAGGNGTVIGRLQGKVSRVDEEDGHEQEHGQDIDEVGAERGGAGPGFFCGLSLAQTVAGQEGQTQEDAQKPQQVDEKAGPPVEVCQQARQ